MVLTAISCKRPPACIGNQQGPPRIQGELGHLWFGFPCGNGFFRPDTVTLKVGDGIKPASMDDAGRVPVVSAERIGWPIRQPLSYRLPTGTSSLDLLASPGRGHLCLRYVGFGELVGPGDPAAAAGEGATEHIMGLARLIRLTLHYSLLAFIRLTDEIDYLSAEYTRSFPSYLTNGGTYRVQVEGNDEEQMQNPDKRGRSAWRSRRCTVFAEDIIPVGRRFG